MILVIDIIGICNDGSGFSSPRSFFGGSGDAPIIQFSDDIEFIEIATLGKCTRFWRFNERDLDMVVAVHLKLVVSMGGRYIPASELMMLNM